MSKMIPLRIADMAVAACEAEIQKLREEVEHLTRLNDARKRMIKRRDKWIWEHRQTNDALRDEADILRKEVERWKERYDGTTEANLGRIIYGIPKEPKP
jgi:bifunctional pyridoxal-dependent enzyme with beta-cystathionase and maltose regulon repressor activities